MTVRAMTPRTNGRLAPSGSSSDPAPTIPRKAARPSSQPPGCAPNAPPGSPPRRLASTPGPSRLPIRPTTTDARLTICQRADPNRLRRGLTCAAAPATRTKRSGLKVIGVRPTTSKSRYRTATQMPSVRATKAGSTTSAHQFERTALPPGGIQPNSTGHDAHLAHRSGMLRRRVAQVEHLDRKAAPGQPPGARQPGAGIAHGQDDELGPRPDKPGHAAQQRAERRRRERPESGQHVADVPTLARGAARRGEDDPASATGQGRN